MFKTLVLGALLASCGTPEKEETNTIRFHDCESLKSKILKCDDKPWECQGFKIVASKGDGACRWEF